jgi:hypothetical protein
MFACPKVYVSALTKSAGLYLTFEICVYQGNIQFLTSQENCNKLNTVGRIGTIFFYQSEARGGAVG